MVKVMLVEDNSTMIDLLNTLLQLEGFEVVNYCESVDLLPEIKDHEPDLVLLDVFLQGPDGEINGFDLLEQIRSDLTLRDIKILMTSGVDFSDRSKLQGADGFLMKPYMPDDLINLIKDVVK